MRRLAIIAASAALAAALPGCSGKAPQGESAADAPAGAGKGSFFETEIAPVLQTTCATCHLTGIEAGGISLLPKNAIGMLVDVAAIEAPSLKRVVPGKPDESYLVMKLEGTHVNHGGSGAQMPFGAAPLPPETIAKFRKWIAEGAKP